MKIKKTVFDFQAEVGLTKHVGGLKATEELAESCHVDKGKYVLDVGCGVGATPCYIAKKYGCKVVGVDILEKMIERSKERAKGEGVEDKVEFRVADAQNLPFKDDLFDAVIGESILPFPKDKQRALNELVRVTKPGGCVGLNESTWLKTPVPTEIMVEWLSQDLSSNAEILTSDGWVRLLEGSGLKNVAVRVYTTNARSEFSNVIDRYGLRGLLGTWYRTLSLNIGSPEYRRFLKEIKAKGVIPKNLFEYFGYGLYVGRK